MRNIFIYSLMIFALSSCEDEKEEKTKSNLKDIELRQLSKNTEVVKSGSAGYFLFMGNANYSEDEFTYVNMCGKVDGSYRFLKFSIDDIRIKIDNSVKVPYIKLNVRESKRNEYACTILDNYPYAIRNITIVCSDDMLPESLLPIDITSKN